MKMLWIGAAVVIIAIGGFFMADATEPQDILIHGQSEFDHFFVDGILVGTGTYVCVPKVKQWGTRTIEIRSGTITTIRVNIGDVGVKITDPAELRGSDVVELSNCQDSALIQRQTTMPKVRLDTPN